MVFTLRGAAGLVVFAFCSFAQPVATGPVFEVASVKPSPLITMAMVQSGKAHVGMLSNPSRVDIGYISLTDLIRIAYRVKQQQVIGPDWMLTDHFDIAGKPPQDSAPAQVPEMLQALLADRFRLRLHHESREMTVYSLLVAAGGLQLARAVPHEIQAKDATLTAVDRPKSPARTPVSRAGIRFLTGPDGNIHLICESLTLQFLAETLTRLTGRTVADQTNVAGDYQVDIMVSREEFGNMSRSAGAMVMMPPGMAVMEPASGDPGRPEPNASIFTSLKSVGLKLTSEKRPVDVLVVDHLDRTPTGN